MGSDSKGALQQGGTHPLETTVESSSITSQLSNPDSKVNHDKRIAETEYLFKKTVVELEKAYVSVAEYICENESKQKEIERKLKADKDEMHLLWDQYQNEARGIELKNQELADALQRHFKELFDEIYKRIQAINEIIHLIEGNIKLLDDKIKFLEEMYQSNFDDFKKNIYENLDQLINEIITDKKDELYIHRHDLRQHIIDHLENNIFKNLKKDDLQKNIASEIKKGIINATHSFVQLYNLENIKPKVEKIFKEIADKISNTITTIHQKQLAVLQEIKQTIATFKKIRDEQAQQITALVTERQKLENAMALKHTSTSHQIQKERELRQTLKSSVNSINIESSKEEQAQLIIKKQRMMERLAKAQRASSSTTSPSPTTKSERSSIQKKPPTLIKPSTHENQSPQENQSPSPTTRRPGKMGR